MTGGPGAPPPYVEPVLGVVFDLDGTLVLSHHDFARMRRESVAIAERYGVAQDRLDATEPIHQIMESARAELERTGAPEGQRFRFEVEVQRTIDAIEFEALPRTVVRPGVPALLEELARREYRLGVLTRSSERFCLAALDRSGITRYFPYLRTRGAPGPAKPSPEALLALLREMEVPRERALYIGDHRIDAECATRARVRFYALLPAEPGAEGGTVEQFRTLGASAVAHDPQQLADFLGLGRPPGEEREPD